MEIATNPAGQTEPCCVVVAVRAHCPAIPMLPNTRPDEAKAGGIWPSMFQVSR